MRAMAVTTKPVRFHFTVDDLELMPHVEGARYELVDGELYVSTAPSWQHQTVCGDLYAALRDWSKQAGGGFATSGAGLVFDPLNAVIPDVVWVSQSRVAQVYGADGKLHGAPDLVVEVLSPSTTNTVRDGQVKLGQYSRWAVREYWIVDWQRRQVEVYRPAGGALNLDVVLSAGESLTSPLLSGFSLPLPQLFVGLP
jgi:Uma2 family endonuclease